MKTTILTLEDSLPLTCTRSGTCCHGNKVWLNPWELFSLARANKISTRTFRDEHTEFAGLRLKFGGKPNAAGNLACNQYVENEGCKVHVGRPLACRLFPLGRQIQHEKAEYIYQGEQFPCLLGCPDVVQLPKLTVKTYLEGQETAIFEHAQDAYLELMQDLADIAFELVLETGLAETGAKETLESWQQLGNASAEIVVNRLGADWMDLLTIPTLSYELNVSSFIIQHSELIQQKIQSEFGTATTNEAFHEASVIVMALALQLARSIGADAGSLADMWVETANGIMNKS